MAESADAVVRAARRDLQSPEWRRPESGPGARSKSVDLHHAGLEPLPPDAWQHARAAGVRLQVPGTGARAEPPGFPRSGRSGSRPASAGPAAE
eukprot:CAMPEP_0168712330 /NCGR_PEP_ID=MMETSP0503-20121227/43603_1 /TAXON_ID=89963 /ORGANISM="Heterocapsa rotundata, Strain SCCAP K-0483" /LENGTH=92 /DNA_ID=CAMNT_0008758701 /DNA_START=7 /DNA_END=282 /DNA_ORIENTATION=+